MQKFLEFDVADLIVPSNKNNTPPSSSVGLSLQIVLTKANVKVDNEDTL